MGDRKLPIRAKLILKDRTAAALVTMTKSVRGSFENLAQEMVAWLKVTPKPLGPPRLTGNLISQIDYEAAGNLAYRVVCPCGYSFWVVVGTSKRPGNNFYLRGYNAVKDNYGPQPS